MPDILITLDNFLGWMLGNPVDPDNLPAHVEEEDREAWADLIRLRDELASQN